MVMIREIKFSKSKEVHIVGGPKDGQVLYISEDAQEFRVDTDVRMQNRTAQSPIDPAFHVKTASFIATFYNVHTFVMANGRQMHFASPEKSANNLMQTLWNGYAKSVKEGK